MGDPVLVGHRPVAHRDLVSAVEVAHQGSGIVAEEVRDVPAPAILLGDCRLRSDLYQEITR